MAITRKLRSIEVTFSPSGEPIVHVSAIVTDTEEGTATGAERKIGNGAVVAAAADLRDAVVAFALAAGKPVTLTEN